MPDAAGKFPCPNCGKRFTWKSALAGKKAKCTCGNTFTVPANSPANSPDDEPEDVYDISHDTPPRPVVAPQKFHVAQTPAPIAAPPVLRPARTAPADDATSLWRKLALPIILLVLIGGTATIGGLAMSHRAKAKASASTLADDAAVEEMMGDQFPDEFNHWIGASANRMVMGMSNSQAKNLVANWYTMGAKRVVAFGGGLTMSLVIELPDDKIKRKPLFTWENEHHADFRKPPARDIGQKWLLIRLHP